MHTEKIKCVLKLRMDDLDHQLQSKRFVGSYVPCPITSSRSDIAGA